MTYSRREAAHLLGISISTLKRRMASGQIKYTRTGTGQFSEVSFSREQLGLKAEKPAAPVVVDRRKKQEIVPTLQQVDGLPITEMIEDSYGNKLDGSKSTYSALGPNPPVELSPRPSTTDHMDPQLVATSRTMTGTDGQPVVHAGSSNHPLNKDFKPVPTTAKSAPSWNARRRDITQLIFAGVRSGWSR
jgi:hypothetical protein